MTQNVGQHVNLILVVSFMDYFNNARIISLYLVKLEIFNLCVAATSINVDKNMYQHVCNYVPEVMFVDS